MGRRSKNQLLLPLGNQPDRAGVDARGRLGERSPECLGKTGLRDRDVLNGGGRYQHEEEAAEEVEVRLKVRNSDKKDERVTRGELHGNGWSGKKIQGILVERRKLKMKRN